jgi:hypothetical protein
MPKGWQRDASKEQRWRQTFAVWQRTGLSGAEYCRQHDLKYSQWNDWQKRVRKLDAEAASGSANRRSMATRAQRIADKLVQQQQPERLVDFAEVQVVDDVRPKSAVRSGDTAALEVVFASGTKLRLSADCPIELLSSVVALLENR